MAMENAPAKNWELTLYELQRQPQEALTDGTEIAVSPRSLQSELMCPICLDILKSTMTTKECLHRFCAECIVTALRSGNKECPTCRKKLVSKRSLRPDPNFDALIAKIYPSREEYEAQQDKVLAKLNRHNSFGPPRSEDSVARHRARVVGSEDEGSTASGPVKEGKAGSSVAGGSHRRSRVNSDLESGIDTNSVGGGSSVSDVSTQPLPEIELLLKPHPSTVPHGEETKYLKAPAIATVDHLSKYLAVRDNLQRLGVHSEEAETQFHIYAFKDGHFTRLACNFTLDEIGKTFWQSDKRTLDLYYLKEDKVKH